MTHTHKAISGRYTDRCWSVCVTPSACAGSPVRQMAHGNIVRTDVCACGAKREAEMNGGRVNYSQWSVPDEK